MGKIKFAFEELNTLVNNMVAAMNDSNLEAQYKTLVFNATEAGEVRVGAYAFTTSVYTEANVMECDYVGVFLVDAFKLRDILKNSSVSNAIDVEYVILEPTAIGTNVKVKEKGKGEFLESYNQESEYELGKITKPIEKKLNFDILDIDLDLIPVVRDEFLFLSKTMVPKLDNTSTTKAANFLFFEPSRVYSVTTTMVSSLKNMLYTGVETEFSILGKTIDFLARLLEASETELALCIQDGTILFKTNNFIISYNVPQFRTPKTAVDTVENLEWTKGFAIDNILLDLMLKRGALMHETLKVSLTDDGVVFETVGGKFKNIIPYANRKIDNCEFTISIKALDTALLKKDVIILLYLNDKKLKVTDTARMWSTYIKYEEAFKL